MWALPLTRFAWSKDRIHHHPANRYQYLEHKLTSTVYRPTKHTRLLSKLTFWLSAVHLRIHLQNKVV